jgi:hypothetical protein
VADPFLSIAEFTAEYQGTLTEGEAGSAERLLQVASDRIRELKPDADPDAAAQVVFEVTRDALLYGHLERFSSFHNITSRRQEMGTFDTAMKAINDLLTDRHKRMLGIPLRAAPRGRFKKCDY